VLLGYLEWVPEPRENDEEAKRLRDLLGRLAANVTRLRKRRGKTQSQVASALGCEPTYIQRLEYGKAAPSLALLSKLAAFFGVEVQRLLAPAADLEPRAKGRPPKKPPKKA
jgi:transcriptional regulator with XRE-family HTH domain